MAASGRRPVATGPRFFESPENAIFYENNFIKARSSLSASQSSGGQGLAGEERVYSVEPHQIGDIATLYTFAIDRDGGSKLISVIVK
jgi:hypothetical protein